MFSRKKEGIGAIFKSKTILLALAFLLLFGLLVEAEEDSENSVVINEVAWMGMLIDDKKEVNKEWIELKNLSKDDISLDGWVLFINNKKIILKNNIKKDEFYLLERIDDDSAEGVDADLIYNGSLNNNGADLILKNSEGKKINEIKGSDNGWPAGDNDKKLTMERNEDGKWQDSFKPNGTPGGENTKEGDGEDDASEDGDEEDVDNNDEENEDEIENNDESDEEDESEIGEDDKEGAIENDFKIVINEIAWMGTLESHYDEWIELKNLSNGNVDLSGWILEKGDCEDGDCDKIDLEGIIKSREFYLLERSDDNSVKNVKADLFFSGSINNKNEFLILKNKEGVIIDKISAEPDWPAGDNNKKLTMERNKDGKWKNSLIVDGTPKKENSEANNLPEPKIYSRKLEMTELMPNPEGTDKNKEWIELFNRDEKELDLESWYFFNQSDKKIKLDGLKIKSQERLKVEIKNSSFSLKNSDGWIELRNPNDEIVDRVSYLESAKMNASYNKNIQGKWEWSIFVTPGKENRFNQLPTYQVDIPNKIYEDVKMAFKIEKVRDKDGENLKFRWDFGDGRKSYLKETSHTFDKRGRYTIQSRVSDLSADVFKYFNIEVQKFPEFDLEIVKLLPNPEGSDSENEKVWILNKEKRTVNLKGWSITTGSSMSKLTNHYFREDFKIKAGDIEEIGRKDCPFSLLNKKGRVVLKSPNGEIVDKVKYEKDKIEDDQIYYLENGEWFWSTSKTELTEKDTNLFVLGDSNKNENDLKRRNINLLKSIFDEEVYDGSDKLIYFNNWLFGQSQGYFFEFIFPDIFIERVNFWKAN
jgi:methyl coenzyme M reductase subunit D